MENEQVKTEKLCSVCNQDPIEVDGLCQLCYEESLEVGFQEPVKEVMPKHGQSLKSNPGMHKQRLIKKSIKIQRRK